MSSQSKSSQESKRDYWQHQIKTWERSGLSQKQYCHSRSLALSTFCYWKRRLNNQQPATPKFYPLAIPASPLEPTESSLMILVGPKQFQVQIKKDFSPATLKKLIATLEQL
jgi:hypothetical protein